MKTPIITLLILFLFMARPGLGQAPNLSEDDIIARAQGMINGGETANAITLLDSLSAVNPSSFAVWNTLGAAHNAASDYVKAEVAFLRAVGIDNTKGRAWFNLGMAQIRNGKRDAGFGSLVKAKETNTVNTTNIQVTPIYQEIKGDERLKDLFPSREDFADPFIEETQVIHEWVGEAEGDQFGWIARNIGDVNSDGVDDMVTSAPTNDEGGDNAGKVYVFSGKGGKLLWSATGTAPGGRLGMGVEYGGDINGDGIPDVVAAAPLANVAYAYDGRDGKVLYTWQGDSTGVFGIHLSGVGDVSGDGYGDILIGEPYQYFNAPLNSDSVTHPGKAHLYSGKDGSRLITWEGEERDDGFGTAVAGRVIGKQKFLMVGAPNAGPENGGRTYIYKGVDPAPAHVLEADASGSRFGGMFLSVIGDMDGDEVHDLYASDWTNGALGSSTGRAYVFSGADGKKLYTWTGETAGEGFGIGVSDCGDVNGDGYADAAIGSWQYSGAAPGGGKVRLHSGKDGVLIRAWTCKTMGDTFGFDTTGLGDVNGDGVIDLLITSAWSAVNGFRSGRVFVISSQ